MSILVTGTAGFIGYHVAEQLLERGDSVIGVDNLNDYYDVSLKEARNAKLLKYPNYTFVKHDLADHDATIELFETYKPTRVVHLAAQAGVRDSIDHPRNYTRANIDGFLSVLEGCRYQKVEHLVYASSSSVYGANRAAPSSVDACTDHPMALYGATKKANEVMAHSYSNLYNIPTTGLRFFTVYGPWGRPDMALFMFTKNILAGDTIQVNNFGKHKRDFTFVSDITEGVVRVLDQPAAPNEQWQGEAPQSGSSMAPYRLYNIGSNNPIELSRYIELIEQNLGIKAKQEMRPMQPGDVENSWADVSALKQAVGYSPDTTIEEGVKQFIDWYVDYYNVSKPSAASA